MSKKSIRSSINRIQQSIKNNTLDIDYDNIFEHYKKNQVSSYTLHLLIDSLKNEEGDKHIANSREFYTTISPDKKNIDSLNETYIKKIELLEQELKKSKHKNVVISFICCVIIICFVAVFVFHICNL